LLSGNILSAPHSFKNLGWRCGQKTTPIRWKELFMRTKLVVLGLVLPLGGMLLPSAAGAEPYKGTWEQQMACTPDVWRLCGAAIPDVDRIVACLRQNTPNLSDGCRGVFESNNSMDQQPVTPSPRGRVAPAPPTRGKAQPPTRIAPPQSNDDED
jgi:hypothetical protein